MASLALEDMESWGGQVVTPVIQQGGVQSTPVPASPEPSASYLTSSVHHTSKHHTSSLPLHGTALPCLQTQPCPV